MPLYTVKEGDCVSSIAYERGLFWETIWNHPRNAELTQQRGDPTILYPGDVIFVPEKVRREEEGAADQRHRFRKKGVPARLRLRLLRKTRSEEEQQEEARGSESTQGRSGPESSADRPEEEQTPREDEPRCNVRYVLTIDGHSVEGQTDDDGCLDCSIPPDAREGCLTVEPGTPRELIIPLQLGCLNPLSELSGVKQRLGNLGFDCGDDDDQATPEMESALRAFQTKHGLPVTGEPDQVTRNKLSEMHRS